MANNDDAKYNSLVDEHHKDYEAGKDDKARKGDCWGFKSADKKRRQRTYLICGVVSLLTLLVVLLVLFLAIIPAMVRHLVSSASITMISATIVDPAETEFQTVAVQKFSKAGPVSATVSMNDIDLMWNGNTLATLVDSGSFKVNKDLDPAELASTAKVADVNRLAEFNSFLLAADKFEWQLKGTADVKAIVNVKNVNIDKTVEMTGFNNFKQAPVIQKVTVVKGDKDMLTTKVPTVMNSTSNVAINFGQDVTFKLLYKDVAVGVGTLTAFNLQKGVFDVEPEVVLSSKTPAEKALVDELLSQYSNGLPSEVAMAEFATKNPVSWLTPSLKTLKMKTVMPGITEKLIVGMEMVVDIKNPKAVNTFVNMYNALDAPVTITNLNSSVSISGTPIGKVAQDVVIQIPAKSTVKSPLLVAEAILEGPGLGLVAGYIGKSGPVDVLATMQLTVDGYPTVLQYKQENVTAKVDLAKAA